MIQRIQTLYLLGSGVLLALFVVLQDQWAPIVAAVQPWLGTLVLVLSIITALAALLAIGLYKNRALQARVVSAAQWLDLLTVAGVLTGLFMAMRGGQTLPSGATLIAIAPLVAYLMLRLARRGILGDIQTVRSMDRIR